MSINKAHITLTAILALLLSVPALCSAQTATENYVKTVTMLDADGTDSLQAVQYYNGLGYPTLSVATAGTDGGTACTLTTYDGAGREKRRYLPVPANGLEYIPVSGVTSMGLFYLDDGFFTESHYDALDRVTAVDIAGDTWRQAGKQDRTEHLANTLSDLVLHYEAPEDGTYSLTLPENTSFEYYPEGTLAKAVSYDADNRSTAVFTDLLGKKIMERTAAGDTYYVYNDLGQLRFVLTPAFNKISQEKTIYAYEYRYDNRGRVVWKKLPGAECVQYWYDSADRMAYMRDTALGNRYRFCLYDRFGRLCVQGTCSDGDRGDSILSATSYTSGSGGVCSTGYTAPYSISDPQLEIVNYYDTYEFIGNNLTSAMPALTIGQEQRQHAIGYLTGQVVYATGGEALGTVTVYDRKGQAVRTVRKGLSGHIEDVSTEYTFTGAVDSTEVRVGVGYGGDFTAKTDYTYQCGKKTNMSLSVSHGGTAQSRDTEYTYDAIGRLSTKGRQTIRNNKSYCSYTYDVHGWLKSVSSGGFREDLYYADGLDSACYNGNISTVRWKARNDSEYKGYNLRYDGCNRLYLALFGTGDNLTGNRNYFNEQAEYDCNGNIKRLRRCGLQDAMHGGFGLVDDLRMTYEGNQLASVFDNVWRLPYAGATDFDGVAGQEYPLTYNGAGALVSDASRRIARIDYDMMNNPVRIQFTDGNVTRYVYSATGEKLRVIYQTAVPNITVAIGSTRELMPSEILYTDSTDYLLGGSLTLRNGKIDKYLFDEGYCQAESLNATQDNFMFYYYDRDHLGNVRQVTKAAGSTGTVVQTMNYYPFGAQFCDGSAASGDMQPYKYNGKEFDKMHGLNTYDYGARQYNPVTARWDRIDPLCEKYYSVSPYNYCGNNPIILVDKEGQEPTPSEAARMAAHVYGDKKDNILTGGWRVSQRNFGINLTDETGLRSLVYERVVNGKVTEYVYATAGSINTKDWEENIKQLFGLSEQYRNSANNAKVLSKALGNMELNFVGHSKGGGEAALNSLVTSNRTLKGRKAFTFNAAGVSNTTKFAEGDWTTPLKSESKIEAYILLTDPLNKVQNKEPALPNVNGNRHYLLPMDRPSVINGHSIDNIIKNFGVNPHKYRK